NYAYRFFERPVNVGIFSEDVGRSPASAQRMRAGPAGGAEWRAPVPVAKASRTRMRAIVAEHAAPSVAMAGPTIKRKSPGLFIGLLRAESGCHLLRFSKSFTVRAPRFSRRFN